MAYLFWHSIWQYLTFFLAYTLTFYLVSILTYFLAYILTFFLAFYLASFQTFILAFFLAFVLTSGRDRCDLALAVDVRRGALWSWVCCSGLAGTAAISRLQLRSGGEHSDLGFAIAVRVWQGPLWSRACSWCPEQEVKQEKEEASWHWHNIQQPSPDRWEKKTKLPVLPVPSEIGNQGDFWTISGDGYISDSYLADEWSLKTDIMVRTAIGVTVSVAYKTLNTEIKMFELWTS